MAEYPGPMTVRRYVRGGPWPLDGERRYDAVCTDCDWTCHKLPHKDEAVAERCLGRHTYYKHGGTDE